MNTIDKEVLAELYDIITPSKVEMFDRIADERTKHLTVVLENIHQEHNASAVLRNCDCFGIQELHVIEKDNKYKVQREIAKGAGNWVDMFNYNMGETPTLDCIKKLKKRGYQIVATTPHENDSTIYDIDINQPMALVFGTEQKGISQEVIEHADAFVKIPMYGFTESFNISVSVAICLSVLRKRLEESEIDWKLNDEDLTKVKLKWCKKTVPRGSMVEAEIRRRILEKE